MTVPPLPSEFVGAWYRKGISIDNAEPTEPQTVWWLQTPFAFADIRVPLVADGEADSFAGHTTWSEPALTWHRELDLHRQAVADIGTIVWDGDDMLEDGTFGFGGKQPVPYQERWCRLGGPPGFGYLALRNDHARLVCVGNYAITIVDDRDVEGHPDGGSYRATAWHRPSVLWEEVRTLRAIHAGVPQPPDDLGDWKIGESIRLDDGSVWIVDDIDR
jgi:hypothetical protein